MFRLGLTSWAWIGTVLALISLGQATLAGELTDLQRGIHQDFELIVIYADTLPQFRLSYDRVAGEVRLEASDYRFSGRFLRAIRQFTPGVTLTGVEIDPGTGDIFLKTRGLVQLREYTVSGPPALLLDISRSGGNERVLPFEFNRSDYLLRGGIEEREGRLENALRYVKRVREIDPSDYVLEHRAGIIEHRLGRYDAALETFARTAQTPELAADARARRAMIYLAEGDTAASGREWAMQFHPRDSLKPASGDQPPLAANTTRPNPETKSNQPILKAATGVNMYMGVALILIGIVSLAALLLRSGYGFAAPGFGGNGRYRSDEPPPPRYQFPEGVTAGGYGSSNLRQLPITPPPAPRETPRILREVTARAAEAAAIPKKPPISRQTSEKTIPIQYIIERSHAGADELEIAREFGMGRDEVSMVLNLARLAKGGGHAHRN